MSVIDNDDYKIRLKALELAMGVAALLRPANYEDIIEVACAFKDYLEGWEAGGAVVENVVKAREAA